MIGPLRIDFFYSDYKWILFLVIMKIVFWFIEWGERKLSNWSKLTYALEDSSPSRFNSDSDHVSSSWIMKKLYKRKSFKQIHEVWQGQSSRERVDQSPLLSPFELWKRKSYGIICIDDHKFLAVIQTVLQSL